MQLEEMQHFNNTPLGEMQSGEMQLSLFLNISTNFSWYGSYSFRNIIIINTNNKITIKK